MRLLVTFLLIALTVPVTAQTIRTVDGVASYPEGYRGTPPRHPDEDPFLSPTNAALVLIDYQPHILMGVRNIDHEELINNTTGLIKSAVHFGLPIIYSHVGVGLKGSQPFLDELVALAPDAVIIDRTNVNAWEEPEFVAAVRATGRRKLIMGGLWTDVCLAYPAIEAARAGFDVHVPEDTVGSITQQSHDNGMKRMLQAGVKAPHVERRARGAPARSRTKRHRKPNHADLSRKSVQDGPGQRMEMTSELELVAIVGSLRKASLTRKVFESAVPIFARHGVTLTEHSVRDVPFYDGDVEAAGDPPSVVELKRAVERADGLVLFTPEYNRSVPAVTKNAVDWLSRPYGKSALTHTPVGIVAQSPGGHDASGVRSHLSASVSGNTDAFFEETLGIARSHESLATEETEERLSDWCERFASRVRKAEAGAVRA